MSGQETSREVWLRSNPRPLALGMLAFGLLATLGCWWLTGWSPLPTGGARVGGGILLALGAFALGVLAWQLTLPRLAYHRGCLLFYLKSGGPIQVPLDAVECFFLGQGPARPAENDRHGPQTANLIVRLAERSPPQGSVRLNPWLGKWCEGYITIRGTWCERLDAELATELNHKLVAAKRKNGHRG